MTIVKSHVCDMCGGPLDIDLDRQLYVCSYCGVTHDYEYFREDDVLSKAERALRSGEFMSSESAYEFMLSKDPHSFDALLGVILTKVQAKSVDELRKPETYTDITFNAVNSKVSDALENCLPEDRDYFEKICEILDKGRSYKENNDEINVLRKEREGIESDIRRLQTEAESRMPVYMSRDTMQPVSYHPKFGLIFTGSIYAALLIMAGFAAYFNGHMTIFWTAFILATIPALAFRFFFLRKLLSVNEVMARQKAVINHSWELESKMKDRKNACYGLEKDIERLYSELLRIKRA